MKNYLIFLFCLFFLHSFSQQNPRKVIDSIYNSKWNSAQINLDSLENPVLIPIKVANKDSIIINHEKLKSESGNEIPITPYQMLRTVKEKNWFFFGQNNLVFNQASFSNWNSGGNNNIGVLGKINYTLSYKHKKHFLENNFQIGYGFVATAGQTTRKTEDFINISSNYGHELGGNYYLSTGFQFLTQFTPGYNYSVTPDPEFKDRISRFMAPAYLNAGIGASYNPNENFQIILRPINGKFTFVKDPLLQKKGRYGLENDGQSLRKELGAMANFLYRFKIYKDITLVNQLNLFSNYISHFERVDVSYNGQLNFRLNKFISTNVGVDLIYDHDQIQRLQLKQTLGIGFLYNLGLEQKDNISPRKKIKPFISK